ncbi:MAG: pyridoxamine 5'-phosphate oxidase [Planctomycetaceae bacterium]|nr:MAG: pyridoxamine 5'-phosphate oxidase [Planctomycetaceae bacterium]
MPRYVAFLRGVSPMNLKMAELKDCMEAAGFTEVKTILSSGNVAFDAVSAKEAGIAKKIEDQLQQYLGRSFPVTIRSVAHLQRLIETDPFSRHAIQSGAKRVVTFLRKPPDAKLKFPITHEGAVIHAVKGLEAFTSYIPHPKGPLFMNLLEKTFGKEQTTRTWETVKKCVQK